MTLDEPIAEAGRRLANAAPTAQIVLFGSHARGDADPGSDMESARLRRALRGLDAPADVIVVDPGHVEEWAGVEGTIIHEALREGRVLVGS